MDTTIYPGDEVETIKEIWIDDENRFGIIVKEYNQTRFLMKSNKSKDINPVSISYIKRLRKKNNKTWVHNPEYNKNLHKKFKNNIW